MTRLYAALAAVCLAPAAVVLGQAPATVVPAAASKVDHAARVREMVAAEAAKQKLVAVSVCLAQDGRIVLEHHLGFEDREKKIEAGPLTMYRWASISKPVTATAAMMLVEAGKLELDADVRSLVPEFPQKPWPITVKQLLCHQGGVVHYTNGKVIALPPPKSPEHPYQDVVRALDTFKESDLVCEPGTKYSYTTHGYMLAGAAVQSAAGRGFWTLVREWIATPAGMTTFRPDYQWEGIEHRAVGYRKNAAGEVEPSTNTDVSWKLPGGGFISTVSDLSRFSSALMAGALVTPESFKAMRIAQKLRGGEPTTYGLGLGIGTLRGRATASHGGAQEKTATYLLMLPDERFSVAVMSNTEGASLGKLAEALAVEWLGLPSDEPKQSPSVPQR